MADATRGQLEQAYNLIQQEKLDQAIAILKPIVAAQPNNADAWWLMANAVSEPQEAYEALNNVLRLKPNHPEAKDLLNTLKEEFPYLKTGVTSGFGDSDPGFDELFGDTAASGAATTSSSTDFGTDDLDALFGDSGASGAATTSSSADFGTDDLDALLGSSPMPQSAGDSKFNQASGSSSADLDDLFATDDLFADSEPQFVQDNALAQPGKPAKPPKPTRGGRAKQPAAPKESVPLDPLELEARANRRASPFMLLAIVLFVVIIAGAVVAVLFFTGILGGGNNPPAIDPALVTLFTSTNAEMSKSGFKSPQAAEVDSSLGKTFMVRTCSTTGPDLPDRINKAMDISAKAAATIKDTIKAAGIQVVSCSKPDVILYRAVAPIAQVVTYVTGNMVDTHTFRSSWVKN